MNTALEKMLRDAEQSRMFGTVEITYVNGVATTVHVNKTYRLTSATRTELNRENRGDSHGKPTNPS